MMDACDQLTQKEQPGKSEWSKAACRSAFRLAQYADSLYLSVVAQMKSAEWATALAVTAHKRQQVGFKWRPICCPSRITLSRSMKQN